jgi:hypothetical protein
MNRRSAMPISPKMDLLRESGEVSMTQEDRSEAAEPVYEGI